MAFDARWWYLEAHYTNGRLPRYIGRCYASRLDLAWALADANRRVDFWLNGLAVIR